MPAEEHDEVESEQADSLDWDESAGFASAGDGIGSLSMSRRGVGYMGPQSGNALLKNLQSIYTLMFPSPESETAVQNPIKPNIAEDVLQSARFSDCCIEWYFKYYNCAYPVLHEGYFRAQCMGLFIFRNPHLLPNFSFIQEHFPSPRMDRGRFYTIWFFPSEHSAVTCRIRTPTVISTEMRPGICRLTSCSGAPCHWFRL